MRLAIAVALALALALAVASPAMAQGLALDCQSTYCKGVTREKGRIHLKILFRTRGAMRYRLCVTPPKRGGAERGCKMFRLRKAGRGRSSDVIWSGHFPSAGRGVYHVRWYFGTRQLGRSLTFRRG